MEALIRFLDDAEDVITSAALSLQRRLARRPRERRRTIRLNEGPARRSSVNPAH